MKNEAPTFNICWLLKILARGTLHLKKNLWLLDCVTDICICNETKLFKNFVKTPTQLLRVISTRVFPC